MHAYTKIESVLLRWPKHVGMEHSLECGWQMHWHPIEEKRVSLSHQVSIASSFLVGVGSVSTLHLSLNLAGLVCAVIYTYNWSFGSIIVPSSYWVQGLYLPVRCSNFRSGKSMCGAVLAGSGDSEWDMGKGNLTSGNNRKWDTNPCVNILEWLDGAWNTVQQIFQWIPGLDSSPHFSHPGGVRVWWRS